MAPKGRKSLACWLLCEVCNVIVSQRDLAVHSEGSCPPSSDEWKHGYIKEKILFGILEDAGEEVFSKIPKHEQDNLVLLSKSALQLCDIAIGDPVFVTLCGVTTIMRAWPTVERSLVSVLICKQAIELHWNLSNNNNVIVEKLPAVPLPAEEVLLDTEEKSHCPSEFLNVVHTKYQRRLLRIGDRLHIQYYGKDMFLTVHYIGPFEEKVHRDEGLQIMKDLERLSLRSSARDKNGFYKVEGQTKWAVVSTKQPEKAVVSQNKLSGIGGLHDIISEVREIMHLALGNMLITEGMQVIRGVLLFGVSGTGKTMLAKALAAESNASVITIQGAEIYSKYLGETESKLRRLFQKAIEGAPSVLLLDEIDALCPKRDQDGGGSEQDRRVISSLLTLIDGLHSKKGNSAAVFVLATTSKLDAIDPSLRRPGRFDREVEVPVPTPPARLDILQRLLASTPHNLTDNYLQEVAHAAHGFVGADLTSLCSLATSQAIKRSSSGDRIVIQPEDLSWALKQVKPSAMREVLSEITNVRWNEIGGQHDLKLKLQQAVEWPLKHPEAFRRLGISPPRGVLMYGPPGCSKTMIAKALATESKLNFISIKGPELFSKWVGESERAVREVFRRARQVAPAIVFFDELDALGGERSSGSGSGSSNAQERVLAQLLTELDGVEALGNVTVVGATNRPDRIDKALLRPGRLDRVIYVPLPDAQSRKEILEMQLKKMPINTDVEIEELVVKTQGYSGAEVLAVCHEAALGALEEDINATIVCHCHFLKGLELIKPRTPASLLKLYDKYQGVS